MYSRRSCSGLARSPLIDCESIYSYERNRSSLATLLGSTVGFVPTEEPQRSNLCPAWLWSLIVSTYYKYRGNITLLFPFVNLLVYLQTYSPASFNHNSSSTNDNIFGNDTNQQQRQNLIHSNLGRYFGGVHGCVVRVGWEQGVFSKHYKH